MLTVPTEQETSGSNDFTVVPASDKAVDLLNQKIFVTPHYPSFISIAAFLAGST
jgi:hypothetical protein